MSEFLNGIKAYRSSSQIDAYSKNVSDWLQEVKDSEQGGDLLIELIEFAKKEEDRLKKIAEEKLNKRSDGSYGSFSLGI